MGRLSLTSGQRIYLDSNILIHLVEGLDGFEAQLDVLSGALDRGGVTAVTSELSLAETLVKPLALGATLITQQFKELIQTKSMMTVVPITRSILIAAADVRAKFRLKLPDAIHVATALAAGCDAFVTQDSDFKSKLPISVAALSDLDP
jgi:predicted nucleic acid-binding protein